VFWCFGGDKTFVSRSLSGSWLKRFKRFKDSRIQRLASLSSTDSPDSYRDRDRFKDSRIQRFKDSKDSRISFAELPSVGSRIQKKVFVHSWQKRFKNSKIQRFKRFKNSKIQKLSSLSSPDSPDSYRDRDRFRDLTLPSALLLRGRCV